MLTSLNASKEEILDFYKYLYQYKCVKEWAITPAFFSKYKEEEYKSLEIDNKDMIWVYEFTQKPNLAFNIVLNKISEDGYVLKRFKTVEDFVCYNQICIANSVSLSILANGDCSVCEMLYNTPEYLLGNIKNSSIKDIWNSKKALDLYKINQKYYPDSSPCKKCNSIEKCRNDFGKRVCYLDIAKSGKSRWDPDPRCPLSDEIDLVL